MSLKFLSPLTKFKFSVKRENVFPVNFDRLWMRHILKAVIEQTIVLFKKKKKRWVNGGRCTVKWFYMVIETCPVDANLCTGDNDRECVLIYIT